jgi:hypothetical protein
MRKGQRILDEIQLSFTVHAYSTGTKTGNPFLDESELRREEKAGRKDLPFLDQAERS